MDRLRIGLGIAIAAFALAASGCGCGAEEGHDAETRALMGHIFEGLRVVLPEAAVDEPFSDATRQADVTAALAVLAENAEALERHTRDRDKEDAEGHYLARSVARDARDLQREHAAGRLDRAAFLTRQITENCIACHARLPDSEERPLAEGFVDSGVLATLPPEDRVALQMATRRFDDALETLEAQLLGPDHPALLIGPLTDYLVVSIRVRGDYRRPLGTLRKFAERPDLWSALRLDVDHWVASLPDLERRASGEPDLATARALVLEARELDPFTGSHRSLAHYVTASSILERWIEARGATAPAVEKGEAFYLRGIIEAGIGRNYWVTAAPFLLETSIRLAPKEPFAAEAFALLERELLLAYEGDAEEISAEDRVRLEELRALTAPADPAEAPTH